MLQVRSHCRCAMLMPSSTSKSNEGSLTYTGWRVTIAAFVGVMVSFAAIVPYTFSLFLSPLQLAFGWKREAIWFCPYRTDRSSVFSVPGIATGSFAAAPDPSALHCDLRCRYSLSFSAQRAYWAVLRHICCRWDCGQRNGPVCLLPRGPDVDPKGVLIDRR